MVNYTPRKSKEKDLNQLKIRVKDVMETRFLSISIDTGIHEAIDQILKSDQTGAAVINHERKVVGFLSQKDCLKVALSLRYLNGFPKNVSDYMSKNVETMSQDSPILDAIHCFIDNWYHAYPIVDVSGKIIGLLTRKSVLEYVNSIDPTRWGIKQKTLYSMSRSYYI